MHNQISSTGYVAKTATTPRYTAEGSHKITVTMEHTVHVEKREAIPDDAAVFHYDELNEDLKDRFPELIENAPIEKPVRPECGLSNGDYVKFTDYYRITCR